MRLAPAFISLFLISGCYPLRPNLPNAGNGPVPRRAVQLQPAAPEIPESNVVKNNNTVQNTPTPIVPVQHTQSNEKFLSVEELHQAAVDRFASVHSYCARLRRHENRDGKPKPDELILLKERKDPFSIHLKWIGPVHNSREVLYVRGKYGDKLNCVTAAGDVPFTPAGRRMALARDSMLVKAANPHHDITQAGMAHNIRDLSTIYAAAKNPNSGVSARLLGQVQRPEGKDPYIGVEIKLPPGRDLDLPRGGSRHVFYCPTTKLPLLYLSFDELGRDFNYHFFDRLQLDLRLDDEDFDPDRLWGKAGATAKSPAAKP